MKAIYFIFLIVILSSCHTYRNADDVLHQKVYLKVHTDKLTKVGYGVEKNEFLEGDCIGLIILNRDDFTKPYNGVNANTNIACTYTNGEWILNPAVELSAETGRVFAYYPYQSGLNDYRKVMANNEGFYTALFQDPEVTEEINHFRPEVHLKMKRFACKVSFILKKNCLVQQDLTLDNITLVATNHTTAITGFYDPLTGESIYGGATNGIYLNFPVKLSYDYPSYQDEELIHCFFFPLQKPTENDGNLSIRTQINGYTCTVPLPAGTYWQHGVHYVYHFIAESRNEVYLDNFNTN